MRRRKRALYDETQTGLPSARANEGFEERNELACAVEALRMPLHTKAEPAPGILDGLDDTVWRDGGDPETVGEPIHCLVMSAVHAAGGGLTQPAADERTQQRIGFHLNGVRDLRAARIITTVTQTDRITALNTLQQAGDSVKTAIVMINKNITRHEAEQLLTNANGNLSKILDQ
jgi:hypothetical protein